MQPSRVSEELAAVVSQRCRAEEEQHGLRDVRPLPLRVTFAGVGQEVAREGLADAVARRRSDRLLLIGEAGAGKTVASTGLVLDLLAMRRPEDPVPVFAPLSSWEPKHQLLRDWAVGQLGGESIPGLPEFARHGGLFLVLDGLGESTTPTAADVLAALHRDLSANEGVVLTCRSDAYQDLVAAGQPPARVVVATVRPLRPGDVADWLTASARSERQRAPQSRANVGTALAEPRWDPVLADLAQRPDGAVAQALSSPEMARLAGLVYARAGEPAELVGCGSRAAVEERLLDRFLPAVDVGADARRRLAFLAAQLRRLGTRELDWWRLPAAVPELVRGLFAQLGAGLLLASALGLVTGAPEMFCAGLGFGLSFGLQGWPTGGTGGAIAWRATILSLFALLIGDVYHPLAGVAVGLVVGTLAWLGYGRRMGLVLGLLGAGAGGLAAVLKTSYVWATLLGMFPALTTGVVFWVVFAGTRHRPSRLGLRLRHTVGLFVRRFAAGFGASVFATLIIALVGWAGIAFALAIGTAAGLAAGVTVWLDTPGQAYRAGPLAVLRHDRAAAVAGGLATGVIVGFGLWLAVALLVRFSQVRAFDAVDAIGVCIVSGLAAGVATALSRSWGGLALARVWFGLTGRLPWRVMAFLTDMHRRGVLIQSGGGYRFRFARHADRLAAEWWQVS